MTIEQLDAMYKKSYALALAKRNPTAMVAAVIALAKLHGLNAPDRRLVTRSSDTQALKPVLFNACSIRAVIAGRRGSHPCS